jgi:hypothetical protein
VSAEADPRDRPADPAGTQPKVDPESLLAARPGSLLPATASAVETTAEEDTAPQDGGDLLPERLAHARTPAPGSGAPEAPHVARFQFLKGGLIAIGLACLAGIVAIAVNGGGGSSDTSPAWSPWRPEASGVSPLIQIANHVGPLYHRAGGAQLAIATGGPLALSGLGLNGGELPLQLVMHSTASLSNYVGIGGQSVGYRLCGLGSNCSIKGTPSAERWLLVKREALELALYTFRYLSGVDNVVVFTPPTVPAKPATPAGGSAATGGSGSATAGGPGSGTAGGPGSGTAGAGSSITGSVLGATGTTAKTGGTPAALFFRRSDLTAQLGVPLYMTFPLSVRRPLAPTGKLPPILPLDQLTARHVFSFAFQPSSSDNAAYMVLQPVTG